MFNTLLKVLPVVLFLLLSGCASNQIYRSEFTEKCTYHEEGDCAKNTLQISNAGESNQYHLAFLEYDDQGQLRKHEQRRMVMDHYRNMSKRKDVLLITFVHGWHHSAKPEDGNIQSFRKLLTTASAYETNLSAHENRPAREVLGVYIGWRGSSLDIPIPLISYLEYLTFWDRKNTAQEVGQQGMTEALLELEEIVKKGQVGTELSRSHMVTIGHSFGAAALYSSLRGVLAERFIDSRPYDSVREARGFGDLVVLVNPAFEALRYGALYELSQDQCRTYPDSQLPKLAILTSETDYGTRWAFPVGRLFSTVFETHNDLSRDYCPPEGIKKHLTKEFSGDILAVGHYAPYMSHRLVPSSSTSGFRYSSNESPENVTAQVQDVWVEQIKRGEVNFLGSSLQSFNRTHPLNPYLNIQVSRDIIKGHNDIWSSEIASFVADLIAISTPAISTSVKK